MYYSGIWSIHWSQDYYTLSLIKREKTILEKDVAAQTISERKSHTSCFWGKEMIDYMMGEEEVFALCTLCTSEFYTMWMNVLSIHKNKSNLEEN